MNKKKEKKHIIYFLFTAVPTAAIITLIVLINIYVFSPVPGNNYYYHTHTTTHDFNEALKITEHQLPLDKIRIYEPIDEEYILEHIYDSPLFKDRLSFSINLSYGDNETDMINIFIPFNGDAKNGYILDNYYTDEEGIQKTKGDKLIVNVNSKNIEYFIKSSRESRDYVLEIYNSILRNTDL